MVHPRFHSVPVDVLTTSREDRDIETAFSLGANSHIVKPVSFDNFMGIAQHSPLY